MIGIRGMHLNWLESYMSDRKQVVVNRGHVSSDNTVICGVPQGSILGPLLFIIFMNDMSRSLQYVQIFAIDQHLSQFNNFHTTKYYASP